MKGIYNIHPVLPKCPTTWYLDIVLNCFSSPSDNNELTLKKLSQKIATIFRLISDQREQTISKLPLYHMVLNDSKCTFSILELLKN